MNQSAPTILDNDNPGNVLSKLRSAADEVKSNISYHKQELNKYQMVYKKLEESIQAMEVREHKDLDGINDDISDSENWDQQEYQLLPVRYSKRLRFIEDKFNSHRHKESLEIQTGYAVSGGITVWRIKVCFAFVYSPVI